MVQCLFGNEPWDIVSDPLFADTYTGINPHLASQYHAGPKSN